MQLELAQKIYDLALETGDYYEEDLELRTNYRRAGAGIVGIGVLQILSLVVANAHEFVDEDGDPIFEPSSFSQDSMGLSTIVY